jgi:hypothetical protein
MEETLVSRKAAQNYKKYVPPKPGRAGGRRKIPLVVWLGVAGLLLVVAGMAVLLRPSTGAATAKAPLYTGGAKLAVDQDKIDFGTVPLGKTVQATFKLTNVGDQQLVIEGKPQLQVKKGC